MVLSDRDSTQDLAPIPSLLMLSAVHHHLIRGHKRMQVGLAVESGDVREVHHVALLIGFGASAVNPYLAMESVELLVRQGIIVDVTPEKAVANVIKALGKGVLKIMSKMGISTVASYAGAQAFEAVGLSEITGCPSTSPAPPPSSGVSGWTSLPRKMASVTAAPTRLLLWQTRISVLGVGGEYQWRREGPPHLFNPETVFKLQHSTRWAF